MRKNASNTYEKTTTWNTNLQPGAKLEGVYFKKEEFDGDYGHTIKYVIEFNATKYGVYGTASLNRQFRNIPEGSYVWIEYKGVTTSKKGRNVHDFTVDYDDEFSN